MDWDPSPLFALSLPPYLLFLHWLQKSKVLPSLAVWGFRLTLLFVVITIIAAVIALRCCDAELVEIDALHGGAGLFSPWAMRSLWRDYGNNSNKRVNNS